MITEFEMKRAHDQSEAKSQQAEADRMSGIMFKECIGILSEQSEYKAGPIFVIYSDEETPWDPNSDATHTWSVVKELDLGGDKPEDVKIIGYGGQYAKQSPDRCSGVIISSASGSNLLDLRSNGGTLAKKGPNKTAVFNRVSRERADLPTVQLYKNVLERFKKAN